MNEDAPLLESSPERHYSGRFAIHPPPPIDTTKIEADGGRWIRLDDGRIVEYFVCGSDRPDAAILVDCPGGGCTGTLFGRLPGTADWCRDHNVRAISVSYPGFGYSTVRPGWKVGEWPATDLTPVLKKEGVSGPFVVTGCSFGAPHANAVARHFGPNRVKAVGLRVPYIGRPTSEDLGLCPGQPNMLYSSRSANTNCLGNIIGRSFMAMMKNPSAFVGEPNCVQKTFMKCLQPNALMKTETLRRDHADVMEAMEAEMDRSVVHSPQGWLYMSASDTLLDHGFDVRDINKAVPFVVWHAHDDEDCPPSHGAWFALHFRAKSRVFRGTGHVGGAFIEHTKFLGEVLEQSRTISALPV